MKTTYKVFGLDERYVIIDAWLGIDGIQKEREMITFRKHLADFENKLSALEFIKQCKQNFEGFEIIESLSNL